MAGFEVTLYGRFCVTPEVHTPGSSLQPPGAQFSDIVAKSLEGDYLSEHLFTLQQSIDAVLSGRQFVSSA